jgi:hypothetical protein
MSQFTGPQHKGAMRERRAKKREEAEARQALTRPERTKRYRLDPAHRLLVDALVPLVEESV